MGREREIFPVKLELLVSGEPLPGGGVSEGREAELLELQLLAQSQALVRAEAQPPEVPEVSLRHALQQLAPGLSTQPLGGALILGDSWESSSGGGPYSSS